MIKDEQKDNLCTMLLFPLLKLNTKWLSLYNKNKRRLVNCYIEWEGNIEDKGNLLLLINNFQSVDFLRETDALECHPLCRGVYSVLDSKYSIYVFNMESFDDYWKFIEGKYSTYTDWSYNLCVENSISKNTGISAKSILDKSEALRKNIEILYGVTLSEENELAPLYNSSMLKNIITKDLLNYLDSLVRPKSIRINENKI
jgi:hypothetical protein